MKSDTINLLMECNAGIKMGVSSIERVLPYVKDPHLKSMLHSYKDEHATLGDETHKLLLKYKADTKEPHPIARMMSDMKIRGKMMMGRDDKTAADVMTDGCNMGVKSLSKYLNEYKGADSHARAVVYRVINVEQTMNDEMRPYL